MAIEVRMVLIFGEEGVDDALFVGLVVFAQMWFCLWKVTGPHTCDLRAFHEVCYTFINKFI